MTQTHPQVAETAPAVEATAAAGNKLSAVEEEKKTAAGANSAPAQKANPSTGKTGTNSKKIEYLSEELMYALALALTTTAEAAAAAAAPELASAAA